MVEFVKFWINCFIEGFHVADGFFASVEGTCIFVGATLRWHDKIPCLKKYTEKWETWEGTAMKWAVLIFLISFLFSSVFVAPFIEETKSNRKVKSQNEENAKLRNQLDDRSPNLEGFINQFLVATDSSSNSLIFLQTTIRNSGREP